MLFKSPRIRDEATEIICSNFIMAGIICPEGVGKLMSQLIHCNDGQLAITLLTSRQQLYSHYEKMVSILKN